MHDVYNILCLFFTILASGLAVQEGLVIFLGDFCQSLPFAARQELEHPVNKVSRSS